MVPKNAASQARENESLAFGSTPDWLRKRHVCTDCKRMLRNFSCHSCATLVFRAALCTFAPWSGSSRMVFALLTDAISPSSIKHCTIAFIW